MVFGIDNTLLNVINKYLKEEYQIIDVLEINSYLHPVVEGAPFFLLIGVLMLYQGIKSLVGIFMCSIEVI